MGRGSSKAGGGGGSTTKQTPNMQNIPGGPNIPQNAQLMDDAMADALRDLEDNNYTANTKAALKMYISDTDFDKQGHSLSQTMNFLLDEGIDMTNPDVSAINKKYGLNLSASDMASMQYTFSRMNAAFHPIGKDVKLQRGAHDDLLRNVFGISDYSTMSESQLKSALVGQRFRNTSPMSTSYDVRKNPFLGDGPASGGREVVYNIKAGSKTPMLFGAKKQSEVVLGYSNWKITDVKYTGKTATPRNKGFRPQIVIDIETF